MLKTIQVLGFTALTAALFALPASAQVNVAGKWVISANSPQGPVEITATFAQDGATVTGAAVMPMVEGTELSDGYVEENFLTFLLHLSFESQWYTLEVEAEIDGDAMTGSMYMAEMGSVPFTGKRTEGLR